MRALCDLAYGVHLFTVPNGNKKCNIMSAHHKYRDEWLDAVLLKNGNFNQLSLYANHKGLISSSLCSFIKFSLARLPAQCHS